jgi:hypothetical protein
MKKHNDKGKKAVKSTKKEPQRGKIGFSFRDSDSLMGE